VARRGWRVADVDLSGKCWRRSLKHVLYGECAVLPLYIGRRMSFWLYQATPHMQHSFTAHLLNLLWDVLFDNQVFWVIECIFYGIERVKSFGHQPHLSILLFHLQRIVVYYYRV